MKIAIPIAASALALATLPLAAPGAAQAATCGCVAHHHHREHLSPAHYYTPYPHIIRPAGYAPGWGYPPPPVRRVVYAPDVYDPGWAPAPPPVPVVYGYGPPEPIPVGPTYVAWRPAHRGHAYGRQCHWRRPDHGHDHDD